MSRISFALVRRMLPLVAVLLGVNRPPAVAQSAIDSFDPNANGNVDVMIRQPDGRIIAAGGFWTLNPNGVGDAVDRSRIGRINPDGTVDLGFWAGLNGDVTAMVLQPDGKVVVAGKFTTVHTNAAPSPVNRNGLARLNPDGRLDDTFDPNPSGNTYPLALVRTMALQPDGRLIIGGGFTGLQPHGTGAVVVRNRIARLNTDGSVDTTFDPNANNVVLALAVQSDGRIVVGGGFTSLQPNGATSATPRLRLARLAADGSLDASFDVQPDNRVLSLAIQGDGRIIAGGDFRFIQFAGEEGTRSIPRLMRIHPDGSPDTSFDSFVSGAVQAIAFQPDGKILLGGQFNSVVSFGDQTTTFQSFIARLHPDGTVDNAFSPAPTSTVRTFVVEPDGSIVVGGQFTRMQGVGGSSLLRRRIARLQPNGSLDTVFVLSNSGSITTSVRQSDGSTIYGGAFQSFAGVTRPYLVRVSSAGVIDQSYAPELNGTVNDIALQSDGRLLIAGSFSKVNDEDIPFLARLNADGTVDTTFKPTPNSTVSDITVQSDGKVLVGGGFTALTPNGASESTTRNFIARLNTDGTVESGFNPSASSSVVSIVLPGDGKILIGGLFTSLRPGETGNGVGRSYLARLNADGTVEEKFNISLNSSVSAIALQSDNKIIVAGGFSSIGAVNATEAVTRQGIARLNADGTLDTGFDPKANSSVSRVVVLPDGQIVIGGSFTTLQPNGATDSLSRPFFAWLNSDGTSPDARAYGFDGTVTMIAHHGSDVLVAGGISRLTTPAGLGVRVEGQLVRFDLSGNLDEGFVAASSPADGYVGALAAQPNGRIVLGGRFSSLGGSTNINLARVGADGTADGSFFAKPNEAVNAIVAVPGDETREAVGGPIGLLGADGLFLESFDPTISSSLTGSVFAVARQSDGKLLVGGTITNSDFGVGSYLMRFNADGSLDTTFAPSPNGTVRAIAVQSDGDIVVGGDFTTMGTTTRNYVARLNGDGSLDTTFDPNANGAVSTIVVLDNGKVLIGGSFTTLQPNGAGTSTARAYIARLNPVGTLDGDFTPTLNGTVTRIVVQSDGKFLVGGNFTTINTTTRTYLARIETNGSLDSGFNPAPNSTVNAIAIEGDGQIVVGGSFTSFGLGTTTTDDDVTRFYLARLNADGSLDSAFDPVPGSSINSIALQSDGRIIVGGTFSFFLPDENADPIFRTAVARLNADGSVEPTFNPIPDGSIDVVAVFSDGSIALGGSHTLLFPEATLLVGGEFTAFSETPVNYLARLFSSGLVDVSFTPSPNDVVHALALLEDRSVIVAGAFTEISGVARGGLARITPGGELDPTYNPGANGTVQSVQLLPDGGLLVGGTFTSIAGGARQGLARLTSTGTLDATFSASVDGSVNALVAQGDGRVLVAGAFTTVNGTSRPYLARLAADGSLDAAFNPAPNAEVTTVALQGDGRILVGGAFTQIAGVARRGVVRLNADGSLDPTYTAETDGDVVTLALQYNGSVIAGGAFTHIAGAPRRLVARLSTNAPAAQIISVSSALDSATLTIGGAGGDLAHVSFAYSDDGTNWTPLGVAQRTGQPGQWRITGLSLPAAATYYLRTTGIATTSRHGSANIRQTAAQFFGSTPAVTFTLPPGFAGDDPSDSSDLSDSSDSSGSNPDGTNTSPDGSGSGDDGDSSNDGATLPGGGTPGGTSFGVVNLSGRGAPIGDETLITGFVVTGDSPRQVLLRAVGPGLTDFGVNDAMEIPGLRVFDGSGQQILNGAAWGGDATLATIFGNVGAFALNPVSKDAALVATLPPGSYTVVVQDVGGLGGIALGEVYLVPEGEGTPALANVSLRGPVGAGAGVLVAGFVIDGAESHSLLIRGVGPALAGFGVADALADPAIRIYDAAGALVTQNDDWSVSSSGDVEPVTAGAMAAAGAFAFASGSKDSAVIVTLPVGSYTVQLSGRTEGSALIEIYGAAQF